MSTEKFCLRWNDFESNISSAFRELREDKDFFDVTLACDDDQIQAHKVILSACSPFFRTVLRRNRHEHPLLYMKGVKYSDLVSVLNFMYHGEVNVAQEDLNSFLAVAEDLKVKGLTQNNAGGGGSSGPSSKPSHHAPPAPRPAPMHHTATPPPPKRPRPAPPVVAPAAAPRPQAAAYHDQDDDIQEVQPSVKAEPMSHHAESPQPVVDNSGAMEQYGEEQYGEYEGYEGEYDAGPMGDNTMVGGDGNKDKSLDAAIEELIERIPNETPSKYLCKNCGKVFDDRYKIKRHAETHLNNISHLCTLCQERGDRRAFKTRNTLAKHKSSFHGNQILSPYRTIKSFTAL